MLGQKWPHSSQGYTAGSLQEAEARSCSGETGSWEPPLVEPSFDLPGPPATKSPTSCVPRIPAPEETSEVMNSFIGQMGGQGA